MTTAELLKKVTALGIHLSTNGGKLLIDAPTGAVTLELKETLAAQKPELIRLLTGKPEPTPDGKAGDGILPIFSKVVGGTVYLVNHNDRNAVKELDGAVYFLDEIKAIVAAKPSHSELKLIHLAKKKFHGTVRGFKQ